MLKREISEQGLSADVFLNEGDQPKKAIIILGGSEGGKSWSRIKQPVQHLVDRGYAVLSLAYFGEKGLPDTLEEIPLEYFQTAFERLSKCADIIPGAFAVLGGSKGAEAALLLASRFPEVKAVVAMSPSSVVWQGIPKNRFELGTAGLSSWSFRGESIPYLPYPDSISRTALLTMRLRGIHETALMNEERVQQAGIPVENSQGAVLLVSGEKDQMWPSTPMSIQILQRLDTNHFKYPYEHIAYNSGHNGLVMNRQCWKSIFNFLDLHFA